MSGKVNITLIPGRSVAWQNAKSWQDSRGRAAIMAAFWSRVNLRDSEDCWLWTGGTNNRGYGDFTFGLGGHRVRIRAHRFAWLMSRGPIAGTLEVCHHCDTPTCVNPAHLFLGTHQENHLDSVRKGRKRAWGLQKLNAEQVQAIRAEVASGALQRVVAAHHGISRNHVSSIVNHKVWAHLPPLSVEDAPQGLSRLVQFPEQIADAGVGGDQRDGIGLVCGDDRLPDVVRGAGSQQGVAIR